MGEVQASEEPTNVYITALNNDQGIDIGDKGEGEEDGK